LRSRQQLVLQDNQTLNDITEIKLLNGNNNDLDSSIEKSKKN
jgi:hypothetical protein